MSKMFGSDGCQFKLFTGVPWTRTARGVRSSMFQIQTVVGAWSSRVAMRVPVELKVRMDTPILGKDIEDDVVVVVVLDEP